MNILATIGKLPWSRKGAGPQNSVQEAKAWMVEGEDGEVEEVLMQTGEMQIQVEEVQAQVEKVQMQTTEVQAQVEEAEEAKLQQAALLVEEEKGDTQVGLDGQDMQVG